MTSIKTFLFAPLASLSFALSLASQSQAQSDPANFLEVYNIGTVPPGSTFDIPSAITGTQVGSGSGFLTPSDITGDALNSNDQLNLFDGGTILPGFDVGPQTSPSPNPADPLSNSELNVFGGTVGDQLLVNKGSTANISGGSLQRFEALPGSIVNISGGDFNTDQLIIGFEDSTINISGGMLVVRFVSAFSFTDPALDSRVNISGGTLLRSPGPSVLPGNRSDFRAAGIIDVSGGIIGDGFTIAGPGTISGGSIGNNLRLGEESLQTVETLEITGGMIGSGFISDTTSEISISGGSIGNDFYARGTVEVSAGSIGNGFQSNSADISGGTFGKQFRSSGTPNFSGGGFRFNNTPISSLPGGLTDGSDDLFTGILADGSVFIFAGRAGDGLSPGTTLQSASVPASMNPGALPSGIFDKGLRAGESLTVSGAGQLARNFAAVSSTLNIEGGSVGNGLEVVFGEVNISGGTVGNGLGAYSSSVNISGGSIGDDFRSFGSTVEISDGSVGNDFRVFDGTTVNLSGGSIGLSFNAHAGSTVNISGGSIQTSGSFFTTFTSLQGSEVNVLPGGTIGNDFRSQGTLNISGGSIANNLDAFGMVNLTSGSIGDDLQMFDTGTLNVSGGSVGESLGSATFGTANFSGGTIGNSFVASGAVNISGGTFGTIVLNNTTQMNISGGTFNGSFTALNGVLNLTGTSFFLDGAEITGNEFFEPFTVADRNVLLSGTLLDGSPFEFDLNNQTFDGRDFFLGMTITITQVPEPSTVVLFALGGMALAALRIVRLNQASE